jgi:drug/metabolite transporter (DMT)-like permease
VLGVHADHDAHVERHRARDYYHDLFVDRRRPYLSALVPFVWVTPSWQAIAFGVFIGVASTAGQWIVVLAFRYADASVLAPFSYSQLVWVSVLGFFVFGEIPDAWTVVGAGFIVASGLYTAHRERVRRSQLLQAAGETSPNA